MPCPHYDLKIVGGGHKHSSAVSSSAYQSGEKLYSEREQVTRYYPKRSERIIHTEIMLPDNAPPEYMSRERLWNSAEMNEPQHNAQYARRFVMALPRELSYEDNLELVRQYCQEQFVSKGMCVDLAYHYDDSDNPHVHILTTMRAIDEQGRWMPKSRKEYILDEDGQRIRLPSGEWKSRKVPTTDWDNKGNLEKWRHAWEVKQNWFLEQAGRPERVDMRSFERQQNDLVPTVHLGPEASAMERRGIRTFLGDMNREMVDRKKLKNPNGLILGTPGSGKSFAAKREICNVILLTDDDIIICDPEGEYYPLVKTFRGQVIRISPSSNSYINPMDINLNYSDDDNPLALKSDFILSLCELIVGGRDGLQPIEKTIIDRAVHIIYQPYLSDPRPENIPILEDLYNALREQEEKEAQTLATALEIYVTGSLNVFNHRTNVDVNNRLVCYDIKELGKQLKKLGMLIVQDQVWGRVTANRAEGKSTRYYMDEFHLLLKEEQTSAYSVEIWKRFRKWGGIPTGITQNVKDLLASQEIENIFENSDYIYMLNQAAGDREILAKKLGISPHQLSYVTQSGEGEGLLFYGNVILPFQDRFPKNTKLYSIMTTKPTEVNAS